MSIWKILKKYILFLFWGIILIKTNFWIEDSSRNRFALIDIQRIACQIVFRHRKILRKKKKKDFLQNQFFFSNFWNLYERSAIGWIERKTKFQIFPIFIFRVMVIFLTFLWRHYPNFRWKLGYVVVYGMRFRTRQTLLWKVSSISLEPLCSFSCSLLRRPLAGTYDKCPSLPNSALNWFPLTVAAVSCARGYMYIVSCSWKLDHLHTEESISDSWTVFTTFQLRLIWRELPVELFVWQMFCFLFLLSWVYCDRFESFSLVLEASRIPFVPSVVSLSVWSWSILLWGRRDSFSSSVGSLWISFAFMWFDKLPSVLSL